MNVVMKVVSAGWCKLKEYKLIRCVSEVTESGVQIKSNREMNEKKCVSESKEIRRGKNREATYINTETNTKNKYEA